VRFTASRGNDRVFGQIEGLEKATKRGLRQSMARVGQALISSANQEILHGVKTGRTYIRRDKRGRGRRHLASAPGETHANATGDLRRSLSYQKHGTSSLEFGYGVSAGKPVPDYASFVEFGTPGGKIKPRPSLKKRFRCGAK